MKHLRTFRQEIFGGSLRLSYLVGSAVEEFLEQMIEVRNVVNADSLANLFDRKVGCLQKSVSVIGFVSIEIVGHRHAEIFLEDSPHIVHVVRELFREFGKRNGEIFARIKF